MDNIATWTPGPELTSTTEPFTLVCRQIEPTKVKMKHFEAFKKKKKLFFKDKLVKLEAVTFDRFLDNCNKMNGQIPTPESYQDLLLIHYELKLMYDEFLPGSEVCYLGNGSLVTAWSGQRFNFTSREWFNIYTKQVTIS